VRIPVWLTLGVAGLVLLFGAYRIWLAMRKDDLKVEGDDMPSPRRGIYNMSRRSHLFVGIIYLLLGGALIATSFGFNPFGGLFGPGTEDADKDKAPTKDGIPKDGLDKDRVRDERRREPDRDRPAGGSAVGSAAGGSSAAGSSAGGSSAAGSSAGGSSAGGSSAAGSSGSSAP
jgi:hypothetical protein